MDIEPSDEQDATWSVVQSILVEVHEMAVSKEDAVQSIKYKSGLHDFVLSLLLQLCRDQITVDDVKEQLLATLSLISFGQDGEPDYEAINSMLNKRLRISQVIKRTFQIKQAMGVQDTVQEVVDEVEMRNISVLTVVSRLRVLIM